MSPTRLSESTEQSYRRHRSRLEAYASRCLGEHAADAQDLVADVFADLLAGRFDEKCVPLEKARGFLMGVLRMRAMHVVRNRQRVAPVEAAGTIGTSMAGESIADTAIRRCWVHSGLDSLPLSDRQLLRQHYYDGQSAAEIARNEGVSDGAVRVRMTRARERLRNRLHEYRD